MARTLAGVVELAGALRERGRTRKERGRSRMNATVCPIRWDVNSNLAVKDQHEYHQFTVQRIHSPHGASRQQAEVVIAPKSEGCQDRWHPLHGPYHLPEQLPGPLTIL